MNKEKKFAFVHALERELEEMKDAKEKGRMMFMQVYEIEYILQLIEKETNLEG